MSEGNEQPDRRTAGQLAPMCRVSTSPVRTSKKVGRSLAVSATNLHLAKMLKSGANVILLDEPSNDLDVNTLRALEDALKVCWLGLCHFARSLVPQPHRDTSWPLRATARSNGWAITEYEEDRRRRLGPTADRPHRITYRKLRRA